MEKPLLLAGPLNINKVLDFTDDCCKSPATAPSTPQIATKIMLLNKHAVKVEQEIVADVSVLAWT